MDRFLDPIVAVIEETAAGIRDEIAAHEANVDALRQRIRALQVTLERLEHVISSCEN